ncbi:MAG: lysophospholipid acyltransferase family protein [Halobacteriovoraceae bacterium]|jgi:lysophospholipid acyltransferase (LPLAT)-like uncharacterized protein|nr:lysophospholipid acyltransferase family protein [Halobacteriovoraceae bacterium]MBT5095524.1 lysophospholipid acyltransferase family protein [Halobacteriovoraceae bacterium]
MKIQIIARILNVFVRLLNASYRYRFMSDLAEVRKTNPNNSYLLAVWHQNLLAGICAQIGTPHIVIVSPSKDGELVAITCQLFGNKCARGSSSRGGKKAMEEMVEIIKSDKLPGAITIDGPKGPAKEPKRGIISIAQKTGAPIVPYMLLPKNYWSFEKSWDQFRLPKPFSKIVVRYGQPIFVGKDLPAEEYSTIGDQIKNQLAELEVECQKDLEIL